MDKFHRVQDDIHEVTDIMRQNIEAVVHRGEHLELLMDKSDGLSSNANQFRKQSVGLRKAMWWKNMKMMLMLGCVLSGFVLAIGFGVCGFAFQRCFAK